MSYLDSFFFMIHGGGDQLADEFFLNPISTFHMSWLVPMEEKAEQITTLIARDQKVDLLQSQN